MSGMKEKIKRSEMTPDEALEIVKKSGIVQSENFIAWCKKKKSNPGKLVSEQTEKSAKKKKKRKIYQEEEDKRKKNVED